MAGRGTWRLSSQSDPRWNASGEARSADAATLSALAQQAMQTLASALGQNPPADLTTEVKVASGPETGLTDRPAHPATYGVADLEPPRSANIRAPGPPRCPACGERVLPMQSRCLKCNTRLIQQVLPADDSEAVQAQPPARGDASTCPGCRGPLAKEAVLCIQCGYDLRTGKRRRTRRMEPVEDREPLPPAMTKVQLGLGFHYARLVVNLLSNLGLLGLYLYGFANRSAAPAEPDAVLVMGFLIIAGLVVLQSLLGIAGSILCAWVPPKSGARLVIVLSLILDTAAIPVGVYLGLAAGPSLLTALIPAGAALTAWILFMVFLMRLARYLGQSGLGHEAGGLIVRGLTLFVLVPLVIVLLGMVAILSLTSPGFFLAVALMLAIGDMVMVVLMAFSILELLQMLRAAIRRGLK